MDLPNIKLVKLIDGSFMANWTACYDCDAGEECKPKYKYYGAEFGKTEFEAIGKACLKCHAAEASDPECRWITIESVPTIRLSKSEESFVAHWSYDQYTPGRYTGREKGITQFEAIVKACLRCCIYVDRSPDSRDPSDFTLNINNWEVSLRGICNGTVKYKHITEPVAKNESSHDCDSNLIINKQEVSINQICEGIIIQVPDAIGIVGVQTTLTTEEIRNWRANRIWMNRD